MGMLPSDWAFCFGGLLLHTSLRWETMEAFWARSRLGSVSLSSPWNKSLFTFFLLTEIQPNLPDPLWLTSHTGDGDLESHGRHVAGLPPEGNEKACSLAHHQLPQSRETGGWLPRRTDPGGLLGKINHRRVRRGVVYLPGSRALRHSSLLTVQIHLSEMHRRGPRGVALCLLGTMYLLSVIGWRSLVVVIFLVVPGLVPAV